MNTLHRAGAAALVLTLGCASKPAQEAVAIPVAPAQASARPAAQPTSAATHTSAPQTCSGVLSEGREQALALEARRVRRCYSAVIKAAADRGEPTPEGKVVVDVRIEPDGEVRNVEVTIEEPALEPVRPCIVTTLSKARLPEATSGGCVSVRIPLNFKLL